MEINFLRADRSNFRAERKEKIKYLVVHYTAGDGDTARNNAEYFANGARGASAHYFVDAAEIWQSVRDEDVAWHCGAKKYYHQFCRNENSIGIELCSYKDNNGYHIAAEVQKKAAELIKALMKKYDIAEECVLRHYDVTHKSCPAPLINNAAWQEFKEMLKDKAEQKPSEPHELIIERAGEEIKVLAINFEGTNYIRLRDLPKLAADLKIEYDEVKRRPIIK